MRIAGYLHDLGKLAIPAEILEKPDKLTYEEMCTMQSHTYHCFYLLNNISGFEQINQWASFHHEYLNGDGYPFGLTEDQIPFQSRIMTISDVFTALMEDRPYREGFSIEKALKIMKNMADDRIIDSSIFNCLNDNHVYINSLRQKAQEEAKKEYIYFISNQT